MMESVEKQWYVIHTYSGYENKVKANLDSRTESMGMSNFIFRVVVPETEEHEVKDGVDKVKMDKTFPGYVLVEMVMTDEAWYIVRNTPGVTGFIGSHGQGSKPTPLLPDEVELILSRIGVAQEKQELDAEIGDTITIIDGAFADLTGKIVEKDDEKAKLKVNIDMFGRATTAELTFSQVQPIR
ncbi:transcription termination/antitermination protein NusG [Apilactobacillus apinorum]|nr:transcription termination/antitermination protein NusG [Apilactobacillus apinorum]